MRNSKGQLGTLQAIILTVVVVGVLLGAGFIILDNFLGFLDNTVVNVANETEAFINETGYTIDGTSAVGFNAPVVTQIVNATPGNGSVISSTLYTVGGNGVITNATAVTYSNTSITYSYQSGGTSFTGVNTTIVAMLTVPELLGLVVLIAMIAVILALVFNVIPGARVSGA